MAAKIAAAILVPTAIFAIQEAYKNFNGDQEWVCNPCEADWECQQIANRGNDIYPQTREECYRIIRTAQHLNKKFRIKAKKTFPFWTWFYSIE